MNPFNLQKLKSFFLGNDKRVITSDNSNFSTSNKLTRITSGKKISEYYNTIPELRSIIDQQADMFAKIEIIGKQSITNRLESPNIYQTGNEFKTMFYKQFAMYSIVFLYFKVPYGFEGTEIGIEKTGIYILPYDSIQIELHSMRGKSANMLNAASLKDVIKKINYTENGYTSELNIDNVLIINESGVNLIDSILGNSRLNSLKNSLDTLLAISESENVFANNRGAIGIISPESPKIDTAFFSAVDKENVQKEMQKYGMLKGQFQYIVSPSPIKFIKTALTPAELDFKTMRVSEKIALCDVLGHSILLLNEMEGSTFSNYETARKIVYENRIIPVFNTFIGALNEIYQLKYNAVLKPDVSKIEALQEDRKLKAELNKINSETVVLINEKVKYQILTYEVAISLLVFSGFDESEARKLVNEPKISATLPTVASPGGLPSVTN